MMQIEDEPHKKNNRIYIRQKLGKVKLQKPNWRQLRSCSKKVWQERDEKKKRGRVGKQPSKKKQRYNYLKIKIQTNT